MDHDFVKIFIHLEKENEELFIKQKKTEDILYKWSRIARIKY